MDTLKKFRSRYSYHDPSRFAFITEGESRTQEQFKDECDINQILSKYRKTGLMTHVNKSPGMYGDFSNSKSYQDSLHAVQEAADAFAVLPSDVRRRFGNDPMEMVKFLEDEKNTEESYKIGLRLRPTPPPPTIEDQMLSALSKNDEKRSKIKKD